MHACGADGFVVFEHIGASGKYQNSGHLRAYGDRDNKVGGNGVNLGKCKTCYLGKQNWKCYYGINAMYNVQKKYLSIARIKLLASLSAFLIWGLFF